MINTRHSPKYIIVLLKMLKSASAQGNNSQLSIHHCAGLRAEIVVFPVLAGSVAYLQLENDDTGRKRYCGVGKSPANFF